MYNRQDDIGILQRARGAEGREKKNGAAESRTEIIAVFATAQQPQQHHLRRTDSLHLTTEVQYSTRTTRTKPFFGRVSRGP